VEKKSLDLAAGIYTIPAVTHSPNNRKHPPTRAREATKRRFLAALRIAGMTMSQWAAGQNVTQGYVSNVLAGRHISHRLDAEIAAFSDKHLRNVA
jgi:hypothetical protein